MDSKPTSRLPEFRRLSLHERRRALAVHAGLDVRELELLDTGGLSAEDANRMVENAVGVYALPLGVALNFQINQRDYLVPMVVEEPSVIAAASYAARMVRAGGGFTASADPPVMIAQIELREVGDRIVARTSIEGAREELLSLANSTAPRLVSRGGGARDLEVRLLGGCDNHDAHSRLVVHLHVDCRDAMGANLVNSCAEALRTDLETLSGGRVLMAILSNQAVGRLAKASFRFPIHQLGRVGFSGPEMARRIIMATEIANADSARGITHNKGIMNGISALALATGNDTRAIEAAATPSAT